MPTAAERLDRLEAENVDLKAEVARLKSKVEPKPEPAPDYRYGGKPYVESRATQTTFADPPPPDITDDNVRELRRIVGRAHPDLIMASRFGGSDDEAFRRFANAFRAVGMLVGVNELDEKHALSWWVDHAQSIVDRDAGQADFDGTDFTAAALAHGVWYRAWSASSPPEFGLLRHRLYDGRKTMWSLADAWRPILKSGQVLPPNKPARHPSDTLGRDKVGPDR